MELRILLLASFILAGAGCASYVTPGSGVSMAEIADEDLQSFYESQPSSSFPAHVAMIRVQDSGYSSQTARGYGRGRYSVVTTRDIETEEALEDIVELPMVANVAPIGRFLVPPNASTLKDLRAPAAKLRADMLLVYSVDTSFSVEGKSFGPLTAISLGFIRNKKANVTATVAGALLDVRTGYVYGATEASVTETQSASVWSTQQAIESARLRAESEAFLRFVDEFQGLWKGVVEVYAAAPSPTVQRFVEADTHFRISLDNE